MHCTGLHTVGFWPKTSGWNKEPIMTSRPALFTFVKATLQPPANLQKTRKMLIYQSVTSPTLQESTAYDSVLSGSPPDVKSVHRSKTSWEENPGQRSALLQINRNWRCACVFVLSFSVTFTVHLQKADLKTLPSHCAHQEFLSLFTHPH